MTEITISPEYQAAALTASSIIEKHEKQAKGAATPDDLFWQGSASSLLTGIIVYVVEKINKNESVGSPQAIYDIFENKETCHTKVVAICNEIVENPENPRLVDIAKFFLGMSEIVQKSIAQMVSSALETKEEGMWQLLSQNNFA